ncbi:aspartate aminotransferase family protein [Dactylosporangium vinaceum]|uniref:Aminotransferase class III-fold pyridoxal phosphate-dependent enzyme n=1 Tax=Dactylosporangium vinaceum TaxID=53362 RepID=A0ABV5MSA3_9ACTN|nr:aspartate aminotransferase family protein [Dactylosporangium vinaceum]UAC00196.1 aspartate aminotransferase family protein [Dactylosporangium vinaceum]
MTEARSTGTTLGPAFAAGTGPWLYTAAGEAWFDGTSGSGAVTLGHQHPAVTAAVIAQAGRLLHTGCKLGSDARAGLVARLAARAPYHDPAVLPTATGAEAVESALKVARAATGRRPVVGFRYGYHGKTAGALALTWRAEFKRYSAPAGDVFTAELPDPRSGPADLDHFARHLAAVLSAAGDPAAIVVEPIQVTEGVLEVAPAVLDEIARQARARGALLVLDEIYTGLGRAGRMFAATTPDLTLVGKTLGNGLPIAAVLGERAVLDALPAGVQTSTFSGHPLACAAASAVLDVIATQDVPGRAAALGARLRRELEALAARHTWIGAPRAVGGLAAFDCVSGGQPQPALARAVLAAAARRRLLLFGGGPEGATVKVVPPVLLDPRDEDRLIEGVSGAVADAVVDAVGVAA